MHKSIVFVVRVRCRRKESSHSLSHLLMRFLLLLSMCCVIQCMSVLTYFEEHFYILIHWGRGTPLPPLSIYFFIFSPFHFSLSFIGFTYFLLLSISSLSTRIVPLRFQARGRRRRPNLVLVCFFFVLYFCYLYSLVKMYCGALFYLVQCSFSALTLLFGSFDP